MDAKVRDNKLELVPFATVHHEYDDLEIEGGSIFLKNPPRKVNVVSQGFRERAVF